MNLRMISDEEFPSRKTHILKVIIPKECCLCFDVDREVFKWGCNVHSVMCIVTPDALCTRSVAQEHFFLSNYPKRKFSVPSVSLW